MPEAKVYPVNNNKFKVGLNGEEASMVTIANLTNFAPNIEGGVEEWNAMEHEGWGDAMMTSKKLSFSFQGKRTYGAPGNDYIASLAWKSGNDVVAPFEWEMPSGAKVEFDAIINVTTPAGGDSTAVDALEFEVKCKGSQTRTARQLNPTGSLEVWENPLVSDMIHAIDLADWIGDFMKADREYDLQYRGEPRIDANDIAFLEHKGVPDLLLRVYEHTLKFNGALSGTVKVRRDMSHVPDS